MAIDKKEVQEALEEAGIEIAFCRDCNEPMVWLKTIKGKWAPVTMELINHFVDCPGRDKFRKSRKED